MLEQMTARHNIQASMRATVENWRRDDKKNIGRKIETGRKICMVL